MVTAQPAGAGLPAIELHSPAPALAPTAPSVDEDSMNHKVLSLPQSNSAHLPHPATLSEHGRKFRGDLGVGSEANSIEPHSITLYSARQTNSM